MKNRITCPDIQSTRIANLLEREFYVALSLIFCFSPVLGVVSCIVALFYVHKNKYKTFYSFFLISLFLALLNIRKIPDSDMFRYIETYTEAKYYDFWEYCLIRLKEPFFSIFSYCIHFVFSGSVNAYIMTCTVISYMFIFYNIWRIHNVIQLDRYNFVLAITVAVLFPNIFSLSAHLMRQFLAAAIMQYAAIEYILRNKIRVSPLILAIFTHTTSALLVIVFIPFFKYKINLKNFILIVGVGVIFTLSIFRLSPYLLDFVGDSNVVLTYGIARLANRENSWQTDNISNLMILLYLCIIIVFYFVSRRFSHLRDVNVRSLFYLVLFLFVFVISNYNDTEIALRFSFYLYFFVPWFFYFLCAVFKPAYGKTLSESLFYPVVTIFTFWFIYKLYYGTWTYNNMASLTNISWILNF
jgi:hypothetical protein